MAELIDGVGVGKLGAGSQVGSPSTLGGGIKGTNRNQKKLGGGKKTGLEKTDAGLSAQQEHMITVGAKMKEAAATAKAQEAANAGSLGGVKTEEEMREVLAAEMAAAKAQEAPTVDAAQIDTRQQDQFRRQQMALAEQLAAQARGEGPSIAGQQMRVAQDRNLANQMAVAASNRGGRVGLQNQQLAQQAGQQGMQLAQQTGVARLAEQQAAQQQLGQLAGSARGQDIGLGTAQAGLDQQANLAEVQALLQQRGLSNQMIAQILGLGGSSMGRQAQGAQFDQAAADARAVARNQKTQNEQNAILGAVTGGLTALIPGKG